MTDSQIVMALRCFRQFPAIPPELETETNGIPAESRAEKIRKYDRDRKARMAFRAAEEKVLEKRAAEANGIPAESKKVPAETPSPPPAPLLPPLPLETPTPPISPQTPSPTPAAAKKTKDLRASRLPENWEPAESVAVYLLEKGFTEEELRYELEKFQLHFGSKAGRDATKISWDKTFNAWMIRSREYKK